MEYSPLYNLRHSLAHILAQAVQRSIDPSVQLGTGPAIDNGFYYDIQFVSSLGGRMSEGQEDIIFNEASLKETTKTMQGIIKEGQGFASYTAKDLDEAKAIVNVMGQQFKIELLEKFFAADNNAVYTFWYNYVDAQMLPRLEKTCKPEYIAQYKKITEYMSSLGGRMSEGQESKGDIFITFLDLCEGGHVDNTKEIADGCFTLDKISGAYRQANENNPMMTRIYGLAFATKDDLKTYQIMMEEARKRDHRVLGRQLQLFTFSDRVGPGLPLFLPNGEIIKYELEQYMRQEKIKLGYNFVEIPHIAKKALYETSGHMGKYDAMMPTMTDKEGNEFVMKAMNCPHHFELYNATPHSYRDLPLRYAENTTCYRNEKTGELSGLTRVKALTQDDTHHFVRHDQIKQEVSMVLGFMEKVYKLFGFDDFKVEISVRDSQDLDKYFGDDELWNTAEGILIELVKNRGVDYVIEEGEAAFYGPKIDIKVKDAIGRSRQLTTIQLDFVQPENFDMVYVNEKGELERPAVLHIAILGSSHRFLGVLIEHFAGAFPLWLAPTQVMIVPVAEVFNEYADQVSQKLKVEGLRSKVDCSDDSFAKKIRNAELLKIPYILIVGEKEQSDSSVSVRVYKTKEQYSESLESFVIKRVEEYKERAL